MAASDASTGEVADAIVAKICQVARLRTLEVTLEIGEVVAHGVYQGNLKALRSRGRTDALYRRVASHHELPMSRSRLWTCVKLYELIQTFPGLRRSPHLGVAHLRAVVNLTPILQERLLTQAETERWTSERLEHEAAVHRHTAVNQGRPPVAAFLRNIERIERMAMELEEDIGPRVCGRLSKERMESACKCIRNIHSHLEALEAVVEGPQLRGR